MEKGFFSSRSFAVLFAPILLSVLVFNHLKKKKKSAEKEITEGADAPGFRESTEGADAPRFRESTEGADAPSFSIEGAYDVFLSFRGSDTRKGFADHLYNGLSDAGTRAVRVFRDDTSLEIGEEFGPQLLNAIEQSKISIPIISQNYASSKWCLRELIHIMDCKKSMSHIVLPIFYKVNPSDVRYQRGPFGEAFDLGKKRFDDNIIKEGKQALTDVSYLNGWETEKIADGHEGTLVEIVIKKVLSKLQPVIRLDVPKHLVGFDDHAKNILSHIDAFASDAQMIGIYGMGGIGKTTLAKIIYNELSNDFVHHGFLHDIRESARHKGITYVQEQLINQIQPIGDKVSGVDAGVGLIKARVEGKKVLMLLDDIDDKCHLDTLAGQRDWFSSGSIIIVTTRYRAVLDQSEFRVDCKYGLNKLDEEHSLILFKRHAFANGHSFTGFEEISYKIISTLDGHPLALEIIGSFLRGKSKKVWSDVLKHRKEQPYKNVKETLKISYDALNDNQKEIFLDIACFFIGKKREFAIYMWDDHCGCANQAIEELELRCLIKIEDDGVLWMHDQLRDLGRSIWQEKEASKEKSPSFHQLRGEASTEDFYELISAVRWIRWLDIEPDQSFETNNLPLLRLVVLQLSYNWSTEEWKGWTLFMAANGLKVLDLAFCENLTCTPHLSFFKNLEVLILKGCQRLERVHPSIGEVKSLISLDLSGCDSLHELPGELCRLESLKELILDAAGITEIPESIGSLHKLEKLSARACRSLSKIPCSIWDSQNLQYLNISESGIEKLPGVTGTLKKADLMAFRELKIILKDCYRLKQVDLSIGKVKSIISLDLSGCGCLKELPGEVVEFKKLKELILDSAGITEIPTSIGSLHKLEKLSVRACRSLREIPSSIWDLLNLQDLDISESAIEELPSAIGSLKKLWRLSLESCTSLKGKIPSEIGELSSLKILQLSGTLISDLPKSIQNLSSLEELSLEDCHKLRSLPELPSGLKSLRISSRSSRLPPGFCPIHLKTLYASWTRL